MQCIGKSLASSFLLAFSLVGCTSLPLAPEKRVSASDCPSVIDNASYTGKVVGVENDMSPEDIAQDFRCSYSFKKDKYPNGFVTIFGSSRIGETSKPGYQSQFGSSIDDANTAVYGVVKEFAFDWTKRYGSRYPILTGAGPGLMEAGSRGAFDAKGPSIGYTTYYGPAREKRDPRLAYWQYNGNQIITDGLIFSSVAMREYAMIRDSAAIVISPGGTGTEWEIFQVIETIKSKQLNPIPIFVVGDKSIHWHSFRDRLTAMNMLTAVDVAQNDSTIRIGTAGKEYVVSLEFVSTAEELVSRLQRSLNLH